MKCVICQKNIEIYDTLYMFKTKDIVICFNCCGKVSETYRSILGYD